MTDESPKPKRRRWRWFIAGVLLFVVGVSGWWYWPRVDQRFVGTWNVAIVTGEYAQPSEILHLFSDGHGGRIFPDIGGVQTLRWQFSGNVLSYLDESRLGAVEVWIRQRIYELRTGKVPPRDTGLLATEILPDRITLRSSDGTTTVTLTRVHD